MLAKFNNINIIFIVIIFYLLSSLAIISHQHCSIYHQQMASLSQHCSSLFSGSIAHGFSLIFAKVTFLIYRTSHYVQKNTKKVIFLKVMFLQSLSIIWVILPRLFITAPLPFTVIFLIPHSKKGVRLFMLSHSPFSRSFPSAIVLLTCISVSASEFIPIL